MRQLYKWLRKYENIRLLLSITLLYLWRLSGPTFRVFIDGALFVVYLVPTLVCIYGEFARWEE